MAVGGIGKKMLGFADEVWEGMSKGVGDGAAKRMGATLLNSNKSTLQRAGMRNLRKGVGAGGQAISESLAKTKTIASKSGQNMRQINNVNRIGRRIGDARNTFGTRLGDNLVGGYRDTVKGMKGKDLSVANVKTAASAAFKNKDGSMNVGRVAGAVVTAGVAGRVATGGGLYRDRNGSFNIPGIPILGRLE